MGADKKELINALNTNVKALQQNIDMHCCMLTSILEERVDARNLQLLLDQCPKRTRELKLETAIKQSIEVLEESRKTFKSKRLEALRKTLTQVLMDTD